MFFWILGVFLWVLIALWPARIAAAKGRSFFAYFLLSIPFWWITLFVVYAMDDRSVASQPA
jgi:ABC-type dipeptide/oligopeptide/nickel transport system permease component